LRQREENSPAAFFWRLLRSDLCTAKNQPQKAQSAAGLKKPSINVSASQWIPDRADHREGRSAAGNVSCWLVIVPVILLGPGDGRASETLCRPIY
jgi:hypothetical protein